MTAPGGQLFARQQPRPKQRRAMFEHMLAAYPDAFNDTEEVIAFMSNVVIPSTGAWAYSSNAKTGTSSTRQFLFELEFGHKLTVAVQDNSSANTDPGPHMLAAAGVFRLLAAHLDGMSVMQNALRLTTARHPTTRALSAYSYICHSHHNKLVFMSRDRFRMDALVGFDWDKDPGTVTGFEKFLDFVRLEYEAEGYTGGNRHFRPQVQNVRPDVFQPHLIGRTEKMEAFFRAVAERLDRPLPQDWDVPMANRRGGGDSVELLTPSVETRLAQTYAADYEWLGEEVGSWKN